VHALRRRYPQIYESDDKLLIDPGQVVPGRVDFRAAMEAITPASHRAAQAHARPLPPLRSPLMGPGLAAAVEAVRLAFPPAAMAANAAGAGAATGGQEGGGSAAGGGLKPSAVFDLDDLSDDDDDDDEGLELLEELDGGGGGGHDKLSTSAAAAAASLAAAALEFINCPLARQPRLLLAGPPGSGQSPLGAALLHELEAFPVHAVGLPSLLADGGRSPEEALVGAVTEARRAAPAVLFLPHLRLWWDSASPTLRATLRTLMEDVPPVGLYTLNSVDPWLETAWFQPLNLSSREISWFPKFAFKFNLYCYTPDLPLLLLATCDCSHDELDEEAAGMFGDGQTLALAPPDDAARWGAVQVRESSCDP
jgi:hypothetical protein